MSIGIIQPYPHYEITVEDRSAATVYQQRALPLFRPLFVMPTQMGVPNEPVWFDDYTSAKNVLGELTFDPANTKYYSPASELLLEIFKNNGAFICRACDAKAMPAIGLLCAAVKIEQDVPQWEIDPITGNYVLVSGSKVPVYVDPAADPKVQKTAKGATIRYMMLTDLAAMASALDYTFTAGATTDLLKLKEVLTVLTSPDFSANPLDGTTEAVIIPLMLVMAKTPGDYGNNLGFSVEYNKTANLSTAVNARKGFVYDFTPFRKPYGSINTVPIKSIYGTNSFTAAITAECIDENTKVQYDIKKIVSSAYPQNTNNLMMDFLPIFPNIHLLAAVVSKYEESIPDFDYPLFKVDGVTPRDDIDALELQEAIDRYQYAGMFNVFGLRDSSGKVYKNIVALPANDEPGFIDVGDRKYLVLGADGDIFKKNVFSEYLTSFFSNEINPNLEDSPRYPFTHLIDVGYVAKNKYDLLDFMAVRDDIQVLVGPYIHPKYHADPKWDGVSTMVEDLAFGASLRNYALLMRESIIKGTESCRASVFAQAGFRPGARYPVPLQFWVATKLAQYDNRQWLDKEIRGLPNSEVDIFEEIIWVPSADALKSLAWDTGLNYCQYFDMKRYHFAAMRSVYRNDTSVLSDFGFVKDIVYTKHEVRQTWAKYSGLNSPRKILQEALQNDATGRLTKLYNGKYKFKATAYQTEMDALLGYVQRVQIDITAGAPYRVGIFDIVCYREGFNGAGEAS